MTAHEARFGVWLHSEKAGTLNQRGDFTWFTCDEDYVADPARSTLGLFFEEDLSAIHSSAMRLPPWFSNLLPEGRLREWIALDRGVSAEREMQLLTHVGHDLPGAVRVIPEEGAPNEETPETLASTPGTQGEDLWRFSLAGVGLKFSMLRTEHKLTLPAHGEGGDWIVKLPDPNFADVPLNEFAMMRLARESGIDAPNAMLVERRELGTLPEEAWAGGEQVAYAVKRFDRRPDGSRVHIEDLAQARGFMPEQKYDGSFETVGAFCYRGGDLKSLIEFTRRLTFNILISNGDAHLKNWSLMYSDRRSPSLSPAYDLVSTKHYASTQGKIEDLGLKFGKTRRIEAQRASCFERLAGHLRVNPRALVDALVETVHNVQMAWPAVMPLLDSAPDLQRSIDESIRVNGERLLRST